LYHFSLPHASYMSHPSHSPGSITLAISGEAYKSETLHNAVFSSLPPLAPSQVKILSSAPSAQTLAICAPLLV
jgi:hypothetical protein